MLLQSHTQYVDILPALPSALPDGEAKGLKARGGFELSIKWNKGALQAVTVKSLAGQPLKLRYKGQTINLSTEQNRTYQFNGSLQQQ
ncbi:glycoside hydrolase family 95-like protein [Niabella hibiscisoli]|uniref:glycoside hydrolase family 95-like protein n=1 Tax=Niabella hibiscisoli TaxID=1825928 RepID=UPI00374D8152